MTKTSTLIIFLSSLLGPMAVLADLPFYFLFGVIFVGIRIELGRIEKKLYPICSNIILSAIIGWATSYGVKYKFPSFFDGDIRIFSMLVITLFSYLTVLYLFKNEVIQKIVEKYITRKLGKGDNNNNNDDNNISNN